jgi:hypothetical protein
MSKTSRIEGILAFAEALRRHALDAGCDLNAANMLVHGVLWRALAHETVGSEPAVDDDDIMDEVIARLAPTPMAA